LIVGIDGSKSRMLFSMFQSWSRIGSLNPVLPARVGPAVFVKRLARKTNLPSKRPSETPMSSPSPTAPG
jgi:hypothetical protein